MPLDGVPSVVTVMMMFGFFMNDVIGFFMNDVIEH